MTSECFVYMTLPGQVQAVTAGKFVLQTSRNGTPLGRFVYAKSYLARSNRVAIDPVELKLTTATLETVRLKGVFGAIRDAGPDYWGRRVIERHTGKSGLTELDYLLNSPDDRAGALGFSLNPVPPAPLRAFNKTIDLGRLQELAEKVISDDESERPIGAEAEQVAELMLLDTAMGGARPKTVVEDGGELWLAKFSRRDDQWNDPRVEHTMLVLARACGLNCAESRMTSVASRDVIMLRRFDRHGTQDGFLRSRMVSGLTLMRTEDTHQSRETWSYLTLADEIRRISPDRKQDLPELFRRICFNALISNTDDHPRNHAVIAKDEHWKLSPAYDLTPKPHISVERRDLALSFGDWGRYANRYNLLSQCGRFLLSPGEAERIINDMAEQVRTTWYATARSAGVSERDCEAIRGAFAYDGFDLIPEAS